MGNNSGKKSREAEKLNTWAKQQALKDRERRKTRRQPSPSYSPKPRYDENAGNCSISVRPSYSYEKTMPEYCHGPNLTDECMVLDIMKGYRSETIVCCQPCTSWRQSIKSLGEELSHKTTTRQSFDQFSSRPASPYLTDWERLFRNLNNSR